MLTRKDKIKILKDFPNIELSYEIHKKVQDFFVTIPKGPKYFAWFRLFNKNYVCRHRDGTGLDDYPTLSSS